MRLRQHRKFFSSEFLHNALIQHFEILESPEHFFALALKNKELSQYYLTVLNFFFFSLICLYPVSAIFSHSDTSLLVFLLSVFSKPRKKVVPNPVGEGECCRLI